MYKFAILMFPEKVAYAYFFKIRVHTISIFHSARWSFKLFGVYKIFCPIFPILDLWNFAAQM